MNKCNLEVIEATNGKESISIVQKLKPNIILMDIKMPIMNGVESLEKIKANAKYKEIPIIAMTAKKERNLSKINVDFDGYIIKPIHIDTLFNELKKHLPYFVEKKKTVRTKENLKSNITISYKYLSELPIIMDIFRNRLLPLWRGIDGIMEFDTIENFIVSVKQVSEKYNIQPINNYINELQQNVTNFDIKRTKELLSKFPQLIDTLEEMKEHNEK